MLQTQVKESYDTFQADVQRAIRQYAFWRGVRIRCVVYGFLAGLIFAVYLWLS